MNKTKIEWCDYTWNPITGCLAGCEYCYARRQAHRFKKDFTPKIHLNRLEDPLAVKEPSRIFVCSVSDFWGKGVPQVWRKCVYNTMRMAPQHTYFLLTKQPQRITKTDVKCCPESVWWGVSHTKFDDNWRVETLFDKDNKRKVFVSCEPILKVCASYCLLLADWIILGGLTPKPIHKESWIRELLWMADKGYGGFKRIPVFMKSNLRPIWRGKLRQEFPK